MNLGVAMFWFVVALVLLLWPQLSPNTIPPFIAERANVGAVVAGVLGLYNLIRWYALRSAARQQRSPLLEERRRRAEERTRAQPDREPDPTFDFTEQSPPPPPEPPQDPR
jgi:hypothetical protein